MDILYDALLAYRPPEANPLGTLADLLRETRERTEVVVASPEIVRIAEAVRAAPLRHLGPVLALIRQESENRWVEYESAGSRIGIVVGRHPANPAIVELSHVGQRAGTGEVGLLRGGVRWLGIADAEAPDWAAIAGGLKAPPVPDPEADAAWGRRLDAALQVSGSFGQTLDEEQLAPVTAVLLQDLTLLAVLSSDIAKRRPTDGA